MTTAEKLRAEGLEKGRVEGLEKGRVEGLEKGRFEGLRAIVRKQLTLKFGPLSDVALTRLGTASADELEAFAERLLLATSLGEVLDPSVDP